MQNFINTAKQTNANVREPTETVQSINTKVLIENYKANRFLPMKFLFPNYYFISTFVIDLSIL